MFNIVSKVLAGLLVVSLIFGSFQWYQRSRAETRVEQLTVENINLQVEVAQERLTSENLRISIKVLQDTNKVLKEASEIQNEIEKDIIDAPEEDNGPLAPVLRNTLDGVDRLLNREY